ncbi:MAG: 5-formyltetrahydrofolate cyclo-ligase [Gammaproteobacteria bacterium]|nr:5-formyltetrahydrofolate cyclo-ligase [Gammaproteobacteria bacterium]
MTEDEIKRWRREQRRRLRVQRIKLSDEQRVRLDQRICERMLECLGAQPRVIGFYWPFRGEVDPRRFVLQLAESGIELALPVVVTEHAPLEFWRWTPESPMQPGIWNIPIPVTRAPVTPDLLLVPLLGFDTANYRLGNGGGYYDRTLAVMRPRPRTIGLGYELTRLESIHPLPHDVPLDTVVTEDGVQTGHDLPRSDPSGETREPASPPCQLHEVDPDYRGF